MNMGLQVAKPENMNMALQVAKPENMNMALQVAKPENNVQQKIDLKKLMMVSMKSETINDRD